MHQIHALHSPNITLTYVLHHVNSPTLLTTQSLQECLEFDQTHSLYTEVLPSWADHQIPQVQHPVLKNPQVPLQIKEIAVKKIANNLYFPLSQYSSCLICCDISMSHALLPSWKAHSYMKVLKKTRCNHPKIFKIDLPLFKSVILDIVQYLFCFCCHGMRHTCESKK